MDNPLSLQYSENFNNHKRSVRHLIAGYSLIPILIVMTIPATILVALLFKINILTDTAQLATFKFGLYITLISEVFTIVILLLISGELRKWASFIGFKNFSLGKVLLSAGVGLLFFTGLQIMSFILSQFGGNLESSDTSESIKAIEGANRLLIIMIVVPFVVPFLEEVMFRGIVLMGLIKGHKKTKSNSNVVIAIIVSSIFFGLVHFQGFSELTDLFVVLWTGLFGATNALLRLKFDSFYPAFASHSTYNFVTAIALVVTL